MASKRTTQAIFNFRDVAVAFVRASHLHEGFWRVYVKCGPVAGVNANHGGRVYPSAFVPIIELGLLRDEVMTDLSVDAAVVNPPRLLEGVPTPRVVCH